jgi:TRAP-type transport system small permease protein
VRSSRRIPALVDRALSRIEVAAASVLLATMVVLVFVDVLLRYLIDAPITGSAELAGTLFVWLVFLGSAAAARQRLHVAVGWFVEKMPPRWAAVVDRFALLAVVITLLVTAWFGVELMNGSRERTLPLTDIPLRVVYAAVPVGCVLMAIGFVAGWRRDLEEEP